MALLRTQGGGLLATGPEAVRANFLRQQDALLKGASAPSVIRAPQQVITEENPFNIGQGLASLGKSLGQMAVMDRERQARAAAQAAGNNPAALMAVQRQFPNTAAGKTAGTLAARLTGDKLRRDRLAFERERAETDFTLRREGAAATAAQRATENKLAQARDARQAAEASRKAAEYKRTSQADERDQELARRANELIQRNELQAAYGIMLRSSDPGVRQTALNNLRQLQEDQKGTPLYGGNATLLERDDKNFEAIDQLGNLNSQLANINSDLISGKLQFGLGQDFENFAGNLVGFISGDVGSERVRASGRYQRFIQKYVNDSLKLARGVQTDNDAERVIRQLRAAKDPAAVQDVLRELEAQNRRNIKLYQRQIIRRRAAFPNSPAPVFAPLPASAFDREYTEDN